VAHDVSTDAFTLNATGGQNVAVFDDFTPVFDGDGVDRPVSLVVTVGRCSSVR
jgi:hypothetical protein